MLLQAMVGSSPDPLHSPAGRSGPDSWVSTQAWAILNLRARPRAKRWAGTLVSLPPPLCLPLCCHHDRYSSACRHGRCSGQTRGALLPHVQAWPRLVTWHPQINSSRRRRHSPLSKPGVWASTMHLRNFAFAQHNRVWTPERSSPFSPSRAPTYIGTLAQQGNIGQGRQRASPICPFFPTSGSTTAHGP